MEPVSQKLIEMGCDIITRDDYIRVRAGKKLLASDITTMPYPGFPTDMQPQFTTLLSVASGASVVEEKIFENRFLYIGPFKAMVAYKRFSIAFTAPYNSYAFVCCANKRGNVQVNLPNTIGAVFVYTGAAFAVVAITFICCVCAFNKPVKPA